MLHFKLEPKWTPLLFRDELNLIPNYQIDCIDYCRSDLLRKKGACNQTTKKSQDRYAYPVNAPFAWNEHKSILKLFLFHIYSEQLVIV